MSSSDYREVVEVLDALEAGYKRVLNLTFDVLTTPEKLDVLADLEGFRRQITAVEQALTNQSSTQEDSKDSG